MYLEFHKHDFTVLRAHSAVFGSSAKTIRPYPSPVLTGWIPGGLLAAMAAWV